MKSPFSSFGPGGFRTGEGDLGVDGRKKRTSRRIGRSALIIDQPQSDAPPDPTTGLAVTLTEAPTYSPLSQQREPLSGASKQAPSETDYDGIDASDDEESPDSDTGKDDQSDRPKPAKQPFADGLKNLPNLSAKAPKPKPKPTQEEVRKKASAQVVSDLLGVLGEGALNQGLSWGHTNTLPEHDQAWLRKADQEVRAAIAGGSTQEAMDAVKPIVESAARALGPTAATIKPAGDAVGYLEPVQGYAADLQAQWKFKREGQADPDAEPRAQRIARLAAGEPIPNPIDRPEFWDSLQAPPQPQPNPTLAQDAPNQDQGSFTGQEWRIAQAGESDTPVLLTAESAEPKPGQPNLNADASENETAKTAAVGATSADAAGRGAQPSGGFGDAFWSDPRVKGLGVGPDHEFGRSRRLDQELFAIASNGHSDTYLRGVSAVDRYHTALGELRSHTPDLSQPAQTEDGVGEHDPLAGLKGAERAAIAWLLESREARAKLPPPDDNLGEGGAIVTQIRALISEKAAPAAKLLIARLYLDKTALNKLRRQLGQVQARLAAHAIALNDTTGLPLRNTPPHGMEHTRQRPTLLSNAADTLTPSESRALKAEQERLLDQSAAISARALTVAAALGDHAQYGDMIQPSLTPFFMAFEKTDGQRREMAKATMLAAEAAAAMDRAERAQNPLEKLEAIAEATELSAKSHRARDRADQPDWRRLLSDYVEPAMTTADVAGVAFSGGSVTAFSQAARRVLRGAVKAGSKIGRNRATAVALMSALALAPSESEAALPSVTKLLLEATDDQLAKMVAKDAPLIKGGLLGWFKGKKHHPLSYGILDEPRKARALTKSITMTDPAMVGILKRFQASEALMRLAAEAARNPKSKLNKLGRLAKAGEIQRRNRPALSLAKASEEDIAKDFHVPIFSTIQGHFLRKAKARWLKAAQAKYKKPDGSVMSEQDLMRLPDSRRDYLGEVMTAEIATYRSLGVTLDQAREIVFAGYADYAIRLNPEFPQFAWVRKTLY